MTDIRSQGRRKSTFPALTTMPSDTTLDFVSGGVNYKIVLADFLAALGVTGTIVQDGDPAGTPVLDTQGTVNNIRNIEDGAGILSTVSAQNGITLEHNFLQDPSGSALLKNITADQPTFVSLVEGAGINLAAVANKITISASGAAAATQVIPINSLGDFPDPVSGVITLEPNTVYLMSNGVSTSNRFICQNGTSIVSYSPTIATLTYTGVGTMLTAVDSTVILGTAAFDCPNGQFLDISETGAGGVTVFTMASCEVRNCASLGTLDTLFGASIVNNNAYNCTQGLTILGNSWELISIKEFAAASTSAAFIGIDLGTAVTKGIELINLFMDAPAGGIAVKGAANSANVSAGNLATFTGGNFPGVITPESGLDVENAIRWRSLNNDGIPDTRVDALLSLQSNATATTIAAINTPVLVAGTWTVELESHMEGTTAGRITYKGERDSKLPITGSVSVEPVSGTNIKMSAYIAVNGSVVAGSQRSATASAGSPSSITLPWQAVFSEDDYVEIWVENNDTTSNILVGSGVLRVN